MYVGARCAGASTAMLLARKGCRVLLVDRARLPSDIPHGHMIHKDGPRRLRDWGLLDRIVAAGTPPVDTVTTYLGDFPVTSRNLTLDGVAWGYGPRRRVVDQILLDAAVAAGAEFRDGFVLEGLTTEAGRVTGIRGRTGAAAVSERATVTIGADGRNSLVARLVAAPAYEETPTLLCYYFSYWSGVPGEGQEIYDASQRLVFAFPTTGGLFAVFAAWPIAMFPTVRADIEKSFLSAVDLFPGLGERLRQGRREERFYGAADLPNFFRKPCGEGWALVGDAGCHKDPYMALGMSDAMRDAELLAGAIDDGLSGRQPMAAALAHYEQRRNELAMPDYQENLRLARMEPVPTRTRALRLALRDDPEQATRFWMARTGMIERDAFFNPENMQRLMSKVSPAV
jgi:2-polyprenyl-6-methoxyphenol hydroxylase-like FAD-dependent oxidoreductase